MTADAPVVSVILCTYNRADLLPRAIDSVLEQSLDEWELIVVDDGSEDETSDVVDRHRSDERVRYYRHGDNRGLAAARNTGLSLVNGRYVATIDDDDVWSDPAKLTKQVDTLENESEEVALVCTAVDVVTDDDRYTKHIARPDDLEERILSHNGFIYSPTVLFRRTPLEDIGGFDQAFDRGIDSDVYRRLIVAGYDIRVLPDVTTTIYEDSENRITEKKQSEDYQSEIDAIHRVVEKHSDEFEHHPRALAARYHQLSKLWYQLYKLEREPEYLERSRSLSRHTLKTDFRPREAGFHLYLISLRAVPLPLLERYERTIKYITRISFAIFKN